MSTFPLTIVIPVHQLASAGEKELFIQALSSAVNQHEVVAEEVLVVGPASAITEAKEATISLKQQLEKAGIQVAPTPVRFLENERATDIASQINLAVENSTTSYVTVLELDDELGNQYVAEMARHHQALPDVDVLLPLVAAITVDGKLIKYSNEAVWVPKSEEERPDGYVDAETTQVAPDLFLSGALVKRETFQAVGGLKASIEVAFVNEFYRRLIFQGYVARGMGKVLYAHRERREGSYIYEKMIGPNHLSEETLKFWLETAAKEYRFATERPIRLTAATPVRN